MLARHSEKIIKRVFLYSTLFLFLISCAQTPESSRNKLVKRNITFNENEFLKYVGQNNDLEIVNLFLKAGINPNAKDNKGNTALINASESGNKEIVQALLEKGADVNAKNNDHFTALIYASMKGNNEIVKILLEKKADVNFEQKDEWNAIRYAEKEGHADTIEILKSYGGKENPLPKLREELAKTKGEINEVATKINQLSNEMRDKIIPFRVTGEIQDRDENAIQIWGNAIPWNDDFNNIGTVTGYGGNIIVKNPRKNQSYSNYYVGDKVYFLEKTYGTNAFGGEVQVRIYTTENPSDVALEPLNQQLSELKNKYNSLDQQIHTLAKNHQSNEGTNNPEVRNIYPNIPTNIGDTVEWNKHELHLLNFDSTNPHNVTKQETNKDNIEQKNNSNTFEGENAQDF